MRSRQAFLFILLAGVILARFVSAAGLVQLDTSSPAATMRTFLAETARLEGLYASYQRAPTNSDYMALARGITRLGAQVFDLSETPKAMQLKTGAASVGYLADILRRLPGINPDTMPGGAQHSGDPPARWVLPGTEIRIVRMETGPRAGDYVFSARTVADLPMLHAEIADVAPARADGGMNWTQVQQRSVGPLLAPLGLADLPVPLQTLVDGTPVWKIGLSVATGLAGLALVGLWAGFVRRRAAKAGTWRRHLLWLTVPMAIIAVTACVDWFIDWQVNPAHAVADIEDAIVMIVLYAAAAWLAWCLCWLVADALIASPAFPHHGYDVHLVRLVAQVLSLASVAAILLYGANDIGVPAMGLLAGVSIGGIALALAAQSTVENLLGGIIIFLDRPFRLGDQVKFGTNAGIVESVGPRSTRIRNPDGTLTTVPNADLAKSQINNISAKAGNPFHHTITVAAGTPPATIRRLTGALLEVISRHPLAQEQPVAPWVRAVDFGSPAGSVAVEMFAYLSVTDRPAFLEAQEDLILDVMATVETTLNPEQPSD